MLAIILGILITVVIVFFEIRSSQSTKREINRLGKIFPPIDHIGLVDTTLPKHVLRDRTALLNFIQYPPVQKDPARLSDDEVNVSLLTSSSTNKEFKNIIKETNEYLCKNSGTSSDLGVLQDICEKKITGKENAIRATLNLPLYFGLMGTFLGIIAGIFAFNLDLGTVFGVASVEEMADLSGLQGLLFGIMFAMIASCFGLGLTIYNTAFLFKEAVADLDEKENEYFDFLRRELMPTLSTSMSSSLNALKTVLGHFVDKFGRNLNNYADSARLLNENLDKQHIVLNQIQKLGVTKMAETISSSFAQLHAAADALNEFRAYQKSLNSTIDQLTFGVGKMDSLVDRFDNFIKTLNRVAEGQHDANRLQKEFKDAIELHFPTGSEGREMWRKEFDHLLEDAQKVSRNLNSQLTQNTRHIEKFVNDNERFYTGFDQLQGVMTTLTEYSRVQRDAYKALKDEIELMRSDSREHQRQTIELHKALLEALVKIAKDSKERR